LTVFLIAVFILSVLYVFSVKGIAKGKRTELLKGYFYAHRGLHGEGVPENSLEAFRRALDKGYGIELDLHLTKDGRLAVIHDSSLLRTAGEDKRVEELSSDEISRYRLESTGEAIPFFEQVLELYGAKAPIIIELKPFKGNHAALSEAVCEALKGYKGAYCIESFDPRCLIWLRKNRPYVVRGQLSENFFKSKEKLHFILKFLLTNLLLNFLCVPDFIAYRFCDVKDSLSVFICRRLWKMSLFAWTLRDRNDHKAATEEGIVPIFEFYEP